MARNLSEIAKDIQKNWKNVYFGAKPYLEAMASIHSPEPNARYMFETAKDMVTYFLANATYWRGETARTIKNELKTQYGI
ncbi:MAG: hypothetical protein NC131_06115 [Roseburia sp.]|nr:hypothetical protein [Roseburia sp.]